MKRDPALPHLLLIILTSFCLSLLWSVSGFMPSHAAPVDRDLKSRIDALVDREEFVSAHVGVHVESLRETRAIYSRNGAKRFIPASTMKLVTTAAALMTLGPDYRYETVLLTNGRIEGGKLSGDLIMKGVGDPLLPEYDGATDGPPIFRVFTDALRSLGISRIEGDILVDDSWLRDPAFGAGWSWDDTLFCYSAPRDGFSFLGNCISLYVAPGREPGLPATLRLDPPTTRVSLKNDTVTTGPRTGTSLALKATPLDSAIQVSGTIARDDRERGYPLAVANPALFAGDLFTDTLKEQGITLTGRVTATGKKPLSLTAPLRELAVYRSPPVTSLVRVINKKSRNLPAEQLFLTLGKRHGGEGSRATSWAAAKDVLLRAGIDPSDVAMADGSGLSRYNLLSPRDTVALLRFMVTQKEFTSFSDSLPVAGVDGTLRNRFTHFPLKGNLRAKTGTMLGVRNLAGYMTTKSGDKIIFSMMANNFTYSFDVIDELYSQIILILYEL